MDNAIRPTPPPSTTPRDVGRLIDGIGRDVRTIAVDEIELARGKLADFMERLIAKATAAVLGATVALIGLAMLCVVVVLVLAPVIPPLWARMLLMSIVYIVAGGTAAYVYAKRTARGPDLKQPIAHVKATVTAVTRGLEH